MLGMFGALAYFFILNYAYYIAKHQFKMFPV